MILLMLAAALVGCESTDSKTTEPPACLVTASGTASPHVAAVLNVAVDGPTGEAFVEYGIGDYALSSPVDPSATHHDLTVLGLAAGETYQWRAVVVTADGARCTSDPGTFSVPAPPPKLFPLTVTTTVPSAQTQYVLGNVVRTNDGISFAAILDREGRWVWWVDSGGLLMTTPKLSLDGRSVVWNEYDFRGQDIVGNIVRVSLDGRTRTETNIPFGHHDFVEQSDGTYAFVNMDFADYTFGTETVTLASDRISVVEEGGTGPVPIFSMFEDFPLDPVLTCTHQSAGPDPHFGTASFEWTHTNSLMYLPETDAFYALQKYTDRLIKIRPDGEVDWYMNGLDSQFTDPDGALVWRSPSETQLWSHGHMSEMWDGGGLVFDNGDHRVPNTSRAVEFAYDEDAATVELVWVFEHPDGKHTGVMGDVRRLPQDHRLVTWSALGSITEVTPAGEIVWEIQWDSADDLDAIIGRIVPFSDIYFPLVATP